MGKRKTNRDVKKSTNSNVFDDVVKALSERHSKYLIFLINKFMSENYTEKAKIRLINNEHHKMVMNKLDLRITDAYFEIEENGESKLYHLEVQSNADSSMIIRIIEYDLMIAIENASNHFEDDEILELTLPETVVLQLRGKGNGKREHKVRIKFKGQYLDYVATIEYSQAYTLEDIEKYKLYFLLPFYLMKVEEYIKNGINKNIIKEEFEKVAELLNRLHDDNTLSDIEILDIQEMIVGILDKLLEGSRDKEGIGELMTGTAFRTDVTDALYKGLSQGISQGFNQGISQGIKSLVTTVRDLGSTKEKAVESIVREYGKDEVEAKELVEKYW